MTKLRSKILSFLASFAIVVWLLSGLAANASAESVEYQEASYTEADGAVTYTTKTIEATVLESTTTTWNAGYYVVKGDLTISNRITVTGEVNLILCDGVTLTAKDGITVASGNTLNIYAQSGGTGTLSSTAVAGDRRDAGIGGGSGGAGGGTITIHGGNVTASGMYGGAGIGGGSYGAGDSVTIYGGTINAMGSSDGAGIGGGSNGAGGSVMIYGGTVTASGDSGAGIGGGRSAGGGTVTISGGTITATGGQGGGAGIGGGQVAAGGNVNISGGTVTASGKYFASGIGMGNGGDSEGELTVTDNLAVLGDYNENPAKVLKDYATTRRYYMIVCPAVVFDGNAADAKKKYSRSTSGRGNINDNITCQRFHSCELHLQELEHPS